MPVATITEQASELRLVKCPRCNAKCVYSLENTARPFCSPQCKAIDLGAWASESFRVTARVTDEDLNLCS
ncbi:MAG: DNA gyrase inhibitor YacG [Burkholderiales bacterium PBB4]|nr:MAG: DNA gyrase inhibitor YacG [Burkholderiales bacterium PBB4]